MDKNENVLIESVKGILGEFDKQEQPKRINKLGKGMTAIKCVNSIVEIFDSVPLETKKDIIEKYPFMKDVLIHTMTYLDLCGTLDKYTEDNKQ